MNWLNHLKTIYDILEEKGYHNIRVDLFNAQKIGGTGGEIFLIIADKLTEIKVDQPLVYREIQRDVDAILNYGKEIGYL